MRNRIRARLVVVGALAMALLVPPLGVSAGGAGAAAAPREASAEHGVDLASSLSASGAFHGAAGVTGTVDAGAWTLVSDLAAGESPRFASRESAAIDAASGPWTALGSNGSGDGALESSVTAIAISGTDVYVGGFFTNAGGIATADGIAKWNGSAWSGLGSNGAGNGPLGGSATVYALAFVGTDLYVGGDFIDAGTIANADRIARWNGAAWSAVGSYNGAFDAGIYALAASGTDLYVGGAFTDAAGISIADHLVRWTGAGWSNVGSDGSSGPAINEDVYSLAALSGFVFAGGTFTDAGGIATADYAARWDGGNWASLGSDGAGNGALDNFVFALALTPVALFVGGRFTDAGGQATADSVAAWNGSNWSGLGSNGAGDGPISERVFALAVSGSNLYVGGEFSDAGGVPSADVVAKWNGATWSGLGTTSPLGGFSARVNALVVSGGWLYVGGGFANAGGHATADNIARWGLPGTRRPDGRIRLGASGPFGGNNVYNTTGAGQTRTASAARGATITYGISIQNDSATAADRIKVRATGAATSQYIVRYLHGPTDITAAVVAGTYRTPFLSPGGSYVITVKVKVRSNATVGSSVTRLLTLTSVANTAKRDAVKVVGKRGV